MKRPRAILVCCEGKTECEYFRIISDFFRPPAYLDVRIFGEKRQHKALIDNACAERLKLAQEKDIDEADIECWAVCDDDGMTVRYSDLEEYAAAHEVCLAFSKPQFEMYLAQHFSPWASPKKEETFSELSKHRQANGAQEAYSDENKSDLSWLREAIYLKPNLVKNAVVNSDVRDRPQGKLFFTVQRLTRRFLELNNW